MSDDDNRGENKPLLVDNAPQGSREDGAPTAEDMERVGYKSPPRHSRFKPGQSGNSKGRPKGATSLQSTFRKVMSETLTLTGQGEIRKIKALELALVALRNKAMKGDPRAMKMIIDLIEKQNLDDSKAMGGVFRIVVIDPRTDVEDSGMSGK